ncbi:hypothetical protein CROQUDRAFT_96378 [Cronartium quercuum f. sp. fusiforme G11]|uniref:Uncharacterized protein n=1 Tax=Cronartium quercuum f. sp. fusiforme G11 TaxID=708437 RepID=A0A9P6NB56_9BASI|nr:hypothetical protein CROQUDRAFT_96378 [Cronartium quercuum f. sp. fusiforme G11]
MTVNSILIFIISSAFVDLALGFGFRSLGSSKTAVELPLADGHEHPNAVDRHTDLDELTDLLVSSGLKLDTAPPSIKPVQELSCETQIFSVWDDEHQRSFCSLVSESDSARSSFAARLTICELEKSALPRPAECKGRLVETKACVGALHASPQSWSSYSGHLREAATLCFGYVNLNGVDKARELYRNTSAIANQLLVSLRRQASAREQSHVELRDSIVHHLSTGSRSIAEAMEAGRAQLERLFSLSLNNLKHSEVALETQKTNFGELVDRLANRDSLERGKRAKDLSSGMERFVTSAEDVLQKLAVDVVLKSSAASKALQQELSVSVGHELNQTLGDSLKILESQFSKMANSLSRTHSESFGTVESALRVQAMEIENLNHRLRSVNSGLGQVEGQLETLNQNSALISSALVHSRITFDDLERQKIQVMNDLFTKLETQAELVQNLTRSLGQPRFLRSLQSFVVFGIGLGSVWTALPWIFGSFAVAFSNWVLRGCLTAGLCAVFSVFKYRRPSKSKVKREGAVAELKLSSSESRLLPAVDLGRRMEDDHPKLLRRPHSEVISRIGLRQKTTYRSSRIVPDRLGSRQS